MPVQIRNKSYYTVAERLAAVWQSGKTFEVVESVPVQVADRWAWRVTAMVDGRAYIGNAAVHLDAPKNSADGTDPFACAETSALGRALAFAGFAVDGSIASADEMCYAVEPEQPATNGHSRDVVADRNAPTRQQLEQIGDLCKKLHRKLDAWPPTYQEADKLHLELARAWTQAQAAGATSGK
jgi:hypothetical protein